MFIYFQLFFWLRWVFSVVPGLSLVAESRGHSPAAVCGLLRGWLPVGSVGSRNVGCRSCRLCSFQSRLGRCGTWAYLFLSMWDFPGSGMEPIYPALQGAFLNHWTTREALEGCLIFILYWNTVDLQCCVSFRYTAK